MLNLLLTCVAGIEDILGNVVGGIVNISKELEVIGHHTSKVPEATPLRIPLT
jgi:hypothetical protein